MIHLNEHIRRQSLVYERDSPPTKFDGASHVKNGTLLMKTPDDDYDGRFSTTLLDIRYLHPDSKSLIGSILQHRLIGYFSFENNLISYDLLMWKYKWHALVEHIFIDSTFFNS